MEDVKKEVGMVIFLLIMFIINFLILNYKINTYNKRIQKSIDEKLYDEFSKYKYEIYWYINLYGRSMENKLYKKITNRLSIGKKPQNNKISPNKKLKEQSGNII